MDVKTGLIILGECAALGVVIRLFQKERAVRTAEYALGRAVRAAARKAARQKELKRRARLNRRALYTPLKPPAGAANEKAA